MLVRVPLANQVHSAGLLAFVLKFKPLVNTSFADNKGTEFNDTFSNIVTSGNILIPDVNEEIVAEILDIYRKHLVVPFGIFTAALASLTLPGSFSDPHKTEGVHLAPEVRVVSQVCFLNLNL